MELELKTAAGVIALAVEGRQVARRAARDTDLMCHVLQAFVDQTDPVPVQCIPAAFPGRPPEKVFEVLAKLDKDDLIRIRDARVDLAYPFSVSPTPFVVELSRERGERYACCAVDALGLTSGRKTWYVGSRAKAVFFNTRRSRRSSSSASSGRWRAGGP